MRAKEFITESAKYDDNQSYSGPIPEVKYILVNSINRRELDHMPEVMTVDQDIADQMDYSDPIEVSIFKYARDGEDTSTPEVTLEDGHHRTAAAIQTGRKWLPATAKAYNASGKKINSLINISNKIEQSLTSN